MVDESLLEDESELKTSRTWDWFLSDGFWSVITVFVLVVVGSVLYLSNLGSGPLVGWDEAIYASQARTMVETGSLHGFFSWPGNVKDPGAFVEKPPLFPWLQAVSMAILGFSEFAVRLPSALAAVVLGVVVFLWARRMFDWRVGVTAATTVFIVGPLLHHSHGGRFGVPDPLFVLFGSCAIFSVWSAVQRGRSSLLYVSAFFGGLAGLLKGPAVLVYVLVALPLAGEVWDRFGWSVIGKASGVFVGVLAPWHIYALMLYPTRFVDRYVWQQTIYRALGMRNFSSSPALLPFMDYPYFQFLPDYFLAFRYVIGVSIGLVLLAAFFSAFRDVHWRDDLFLVWWFVFPIWFFVLFGTHPWYLLPVVVPACLLVGRLASRSAKFVTGWIGRYWADIVDGLLVVVLLVGVLVVPSGYGWPGMPSNPWGVDQRRLAQHCDSLGGETIVVADRFVRGNAFPLEFYMPGKDSVRVVDGLSQPYQCLNGFGEVVSLPDGLVGSRGPGDG